MKKAVAVVILILLTLTLTILYFGVFDKKPEGGVRTVVHNFEEVSTLSWQEKAVTATKAFVALNRYTLAKTIINLTHPTATKPELLKYEVFNRDKMSVQVHLTIKFQGQLSNKEYIQIGTWGFSKYEESFYQIIEDNAPFQGRKKSLKRLDEWFRTEIFPALKESI